MTYKWPLMKNTISLKDKLVMIWFIATTNKFTNGSKVIEFESQWNQWLGSSYSLYVSSGSTANSLLIAAVKEKYGLSNGDKVLVPSCTWVTNIGPVMQSGLTPIFCDINLDNFSFDLGHMKKIAKAHPDIKMIFVTHLLGYSADIESYREIFPNAHIVEDICESHGVISPNGVKRGADSLGATFSFYFGHHMTTIEGGMVSTYDEELYHLMKIKRSHGLARELPYKQFLEAKKKYPNVDPKFLFLTDGYNFRNTEIGAVLGSSQLKRLDRTVNIRNNNYNMFLESVSHYSDHFYIPTNSSTNSNYAFPLIAKKKNVADKLKMNLEHAGIETRPIVSGNLLLQPFLSNYSIEPGSNMNIQIVHDNGVYVGNNHLIGRKEIDMLNDVLSNTIDK